MALLILYSYSYLGQAIKMQQTKMKVIKKNEVSLFWEQEQKVLGCDICDTVSAKLLTLGSSLSLFLVLLTFLFFPFRLLSSVSHICHFLDQKNTFLAEELSQSWLKMPTFPATLSPFQRYLKSSYFTLLPFNYMIKALKLSIWVILSFHWRNLSLK